MKKQNLLFTVIVAMFLVFTSCGEGEASSGNSIIGKWKIINAEGTAASLNVGMVYEFNDDGNATVGSGIMASKYTYTAKNDTLTMNYDGGSDIILTWIYKIDGNKMTMENATDASQKFELEK